MAAVFLVALNRKVLTVVAQGVVVAVCNILAVAFFDSAGLHQLSPRLVAGRSPLDLLGRSAIGPAMRHGLLLRAVGGRRPNP